MKRLPFTLKPALRLRRSGASNEVSAEIVDEALLRSRRGIYAVVENDTVVYCGKYENGLDKRWLYRRSQRLYHFKQDRVAEALAQQRDVTVWAEDEDAIKAQLGLGGHAWVNTSGMEAALIALLQPAWNKNGKRLQRRA